jgi:transcriptional regulator GlxA family with amidase domain
LDEALTALARHDEVAAAARSVGVSVRTMERHVGRSSQRRPAYWKQLARVRRAAHALSGSQSLASIAAACGFADQAHMTREFRRWFNLVPKALRREPNLLRILQASGYA